MTDSAAPRGPVRAGILYQGKGCVTFDFDPANDVPKPARTTQTVSSTYSTYKTYMRHLQDIYCTRTYKYSVQVLYTVHIVVGPLSLSFCSSPLVDFRQTYS